MLNMSQSYDERCRTLVGFEYDGARWVSDVEMMNILEQGYILKGRKEFKKMFDIGVNCGRICAAFLWRCREAEILD